MKGVSRIEFGMYVILYRSWWQENSFTDVHTFLRSAYYASLDAASVSKAEDACTVLLGECIGPIPAQFWYVVVCW